MSDTIQIVFKKYPEGIQILPGYFDQMDSASYEGICFLLYYQIIHFETLWNNDFNITNKLVSKGTRIELRETLKLTGTEFSFTATIGLLKNIYL